MLRVHHHVIRNPLLGHVVEIVVCLPGVSKLGRPASPRWREMMGKKERIPGTAGVEGGVGMEVVVAAKEGGALRVGLGDSTVGIDISHIEEATTSDR